MPIKGAIKLTPSSGATFVYFYRHCPRQRKIGYNTTRIMLKTTVTVILSHGLQYINDIQWITDYILYNNLRQKGYVLPGVCLFVCLLITS